MSDNITPSLTEGGGVSKEDTTKKSEEESLKEDTSKETKVEETKKPTETSESKKEDDDNEDGSTEDPEVVKQRKNSDDKIRELSEEVYKKDVALVKKDNAHLTELAETDAKRADRISREVWGKSYADLLEDARAEEDKKNPPPTEELVRREVDRQNSASQLQNALNSTLADFVKEKEIGGDKELDDKMGVNFWGVWDSVAESKKTPEKMRALLEMAYLKSTQGTREKEEAEEEKAEADGAVKAEAEAVNTSKTRSERKGKVVLTSDEKEMAKKIGMSEEDYFDSKQSMNSTEQI